MKKKVVLGNVKHSGNKRDISLNRSESDDSVYSDVESLSGENENINMSGMDGESFLGSAITTPKAKQVNIVTIKKSFALDINFLAVEGKSTTVKTQLIRKFFSLVNGFEGAITPSKFEEIIRSTFISEKSIKMAMLLAKEKEININSNLKKQEIRSD
ncbi:hypothetical protein G9A89_017757 [Geosiphon pyriformis]|nr:hypothetical protein G9A89_017757 [Geosiphon pyriformis]